MYYGAGRGGGGGGRGRVWGGGGGGVVGTCWLLNSHWSTEVTRAMTAYIGPAIARQLWQLWQLAWAVTAYIRLLCLPYLGIYITYPCFKYFS